MNILLSNISLFEIGGSETWVRTMYDYLSKRHNVHVFAFTNRLWPDMTRYNRNITYDLAILNHHQTLTHLATVGNLARIILTSHGVIPEPERPRVGADVYVGVSEEVVAMLNDEGFPGQVIRNPINMARFRNTRHVNDELRNVLFLSNHQGNARSVIEEACQGYNLKVYGLADKRVDVENAINEADLVIGLGRVAYEAMSCERNVIVYDYLGGDGFVTPSKMKAFRKHNCSGRFGKLSFTAETLREEMAKYDPSLGPRLRDYIRENNDVAKISQQYLEL